MGGNKPQLIAQLFQKLLLMKLSMAFPIKNSASYKHIPNISFNERRAT